MWLALVHSTPELESNSTTHRNVLYAPALSFIGFSTLTINTRQLPHQASNMSDDGYRNHNRSFRTITNTDSHDIVTDTTSLRF